LEYLVATLDQPVDLFEEVFLSLLLEIEQGLKAA